MSLQLVYNYIYMYTKYEMGFFLHFQQNIIVVLYYWAFVFIIVWISLGIIILVDGNLKVQPMCISSCQVDCLKC